MAYKSRHTGKEIDEAVDIIQQGGGTSQPTEIDYAIPITYSALRELKLADGLTAGMCYRITDYVTETTQKDTQSAGHPFDIIVMALDAHTLSEEAMAIQHEGDTYFAKCNLAAWKLMYNFDNDTNRYGWSKKWVEEAPQKWSCQWGLIEEKLNNDASTNYTTAVVDGKTKYLYKPASPTNHLDGKSFYERVVTGSITSYDGLIFEAYDTPYNEGDDEDPMWYWEDMGNIVVKTADGTQIATLYNDGGSFVDTRDSDYMYYIEFDPDAVEVDEGVYHFTPTYGLEEWWDNVQGGSVNTYENIPYTGSNDVLLYAFDSVLPKSSKAVTEVYSPNTNTVYLYEGGQLDTITYTKYTAAVEGHKGVIYRMIDEYGNEARYDFKNIQHKISNEWYYTFGATDKSLNGTSFDNVIDVSNAKKLPIVVIKGTASLNEIRIVISGKLIANDIKGTRIAESYNITNITFGENVYSCLITGLKGTLTAEDRLNTVVISQCNGLTLKGEYYYSRFEGTGSLSVVDKNGNSKMMRGVSVILGNSAYGSESKVTLVDNTTSSANTATDSFIVYAPNWGSETIDISNSFSTSAPKRMLKIAKNSDGVVKIWCEADLVQ